MKASHYSRNCPSPNPNIPACALHFSDYVIVAGRGDASDEQSPDQHRGSTVYLSRT